MELTDDIFDISMDMDSLPPSASSKSGGGGAGLSAHTVMDDMELLMNEKKIQNNPFQKSHMDLDNLEQSLDFDLNPSSSSKGGDKSSSSSSFFPGLDDHNDVDLDPLPSSSSSKSATENSGVKDNILFEDTSYNAPASSSTIHGIGRGETSWDNYARFPGSSSSGVGGGGGGGGFDHGSSNNNGFGGGGGRRDDPLRKKLRCLIQLEKLKKRGFPVTKNYTTESNLQEMEAELDILRDEGACQASILFQKNTISQFMYGLEYLNGYINPFNLQLNGLGEAVNENLDDYDSICEALYHKYEGKFDIYPEIRLMFQLIYAVGTVHLMNMSMGGLGLRQHAMPPQETIFSQDPEMARNYHEAAIQSAYRGGNPGFANMASGILHQGMNPPPAPPTMMMGGAAAAPAPHISITNRHGKPIEPPGAPFLVHPQANPPHSRPQMKGPNIDMAGVDQLLSTLPTRSAVVYNTTPPRPTTDTVNAALQPSFPIPPLVTRDTPSSSSSQQQQQPTTRRRRSNPPSARSTASSNVEDIVLDM